LKEHISGLLYLYEEMQKRYDNANPSHIHLREQLEVLITQAIRVFMCKPYKPDYRETMADARSRIENSILSLIQR
jgi:hypothetical protein